MRKTDLLSFARRLALPMLLFAGCSNYTYVRTKDGHEVPTQSTRGYTDHVVVEDARSGEKVVLRRDQVESVTHAGSGGRWLGLGLVGVGASLGVAGAVVLSNPSVARDSEASPQLQGASMAFLGCVVGVPGLIVTMLSFHRYAKSVEGWEGSDKPPPTPSLSFSDRHVTLGIGASF